MKLLKQYNLVQLVVIICIVLITGAAYYQSISWVLTRQNDKDLKNVETEIVEYLHYNRRLPQMFNSKYQQITFTAIGMAAIKREFIDTVYFKKWDINNPKRLRYHEEGQFEAARGLITPVKVGNQLYKIVIIQSKAETEDLISIIFSITAGVILVLLLALLITNRLIINRLWKPFYIIMNELRGFNIASEGEVLALNTRTDEFKELNQVVITMTGKAKKDYQSLKNFTENASHELLTPIAGIRSKLDSLIQTDQFTAQQSNLLDDLYKGVNRLNRLNQSLLLLVKIENGLIRDRQLINLRELTEETISQFNDFISEKSIKLIKEIEPCEIVASPYLIEILISNLIANAIRHNYKGGKIIINLSRESFVIQNTGDKEPLAAAEIFNRFHKSPSSDGSGLGLTISHQICANFNFSLDYNFNKGLHTFTVHLV